MMQEVAADQAIMQLMDARGTLMELKVTTLADMPLHIISIVRHHNFRGSAMHSITFMSTCSKSHEPAHW